jgi:hypothetical protein
MKVRGILTEIEAIGKSLKDSTFLKIIEITVNLVSSEGYFFTGPKMVKSNPSLTIKKSLRLRA